MQGLLEAADANSPTVSTWTVGLSLGVFIGLYVVLLVANIVLVRRYAPRPGERRPPRSFDNRR